MTIREKIEAITKDHNITQGELATRVGVNRATISQIKGGAKFSEDLKKSIIEEFGLIDDYFEQTKEIELDLQFTTMTPSALLVIIKEQSETLKEQSMAIKMLTKKLTEVS